VLTIAILVAALVVLGYLANRISVDSAADGRGFRACEGQFTNRILRTRTDVRQGARPGVQPLRVRSAKTEQPATVWVYLTQWRAGGDGAEMAQSEEFLTPIRLPVGEKRWGPATRMRKPAF